MGIKRKTIVLAGVHWFILVVLCHIVLCSHSQRHHRGHSSVPILSASLGNGGDGTIVSSNSGSDEATAVGESDVLNDGDDAAAAGQMDDDASALLGKDNVKSLTKGKKLLLNTFIKGPTISPLIPQLKIKPGHELKLKCDLNNTYGGRIMWLLNGQAIRTDNGRYSIQGPSANRAIEGRLTINNVLPEDTGIWQCHETKFDGKEHLSRPIWVVVLASPRAIHLEFDGFRLPPSSPPSTRVTYREKDNISVHCVVEGGNPPPRVHWFYNSVNVTNGSSVSTDYLDEEKVYLTRSSLHLPNISRTDLNNSVVCIAEHELIAAPPLPLPFQEESPLIFGPESLYLRAAAYFNIEYPPSFIISRIPGFGYPIREGIAMALKCDIDANPWSRPIWMKDGGEPLPTVSTEDGFLNFSRVERNHTGWYKCISHHPMGKYSSVGYYLSVRYEPSILDQSPPQVEASVGDKASLKCEADGRPSPSVCWSRIGYGGSLNSVGSGQELILDNILYQEAGSYRCVASNRPGLEERKAQSRDIQLVVTGRPVVYPSNRTIMGFTGQPLSMSVEMCANPMPSKLLWIFGNTVLRPGSRHRNSKYVAQRLAGGESKDCYLAVLTIQNVSSEDEGEYMFFVKNSKGIHEGTILLNITQASFSISSSATSTSGVVANGQQQQVQVPSHPFHHLLLVIAATSIFLCC